MIISHPPKSVHARALGLIAAATVWLAGQGALGQTMPMSQTQSGDVSIEGAMVEPAKLRLDMRGTRPLAISDVQAKWNGQELKLRQWNAYPTQGATSQVLLLIDTSDQRRQQQIERVTEQLRQIESIAKPHQRFAVATYDTDLTIWLPPNSTAAQVPGALAGIAATGKASELFKSTLNAIKRLAEMPVARRAIFLFSDGLAEDAAYQAEDVVTAARAAGVVIYTFGTAAGQALGGARANLQALSVGSGGVDMQISDDAGRLRASLVGALAALDSGGFGYFDAPADIVAKGGDIVVTWSEAGKNAEATLQFRTRNIAVDMGEPKQLPPVETRDPVVIWLVAGGGSLAVGVLVLLLARRRRPAGSAEPLAWLDVMAQERKRITVDRLPFRIGRSGDNALVLPTDTISNYHAEIVRDEEGRLQIRDMASKNGLYVNLTKTASVTLQNGDLIELGDIKIRYRAA